MSDGLTDKRGQDDGYPSIGAFAVKAGLLLEQTPNGGWIVSQKSDHPGIMSAAIGAYSTGAEMLDALREHIT